MVRGLVSFGLMSLTMFATAAGPLPQLVSPIEGLKPAGIQDTYTQIHNGHPHEAIDIMTPRDTPVHAVAPGAIRKLFLSKPGGNTIYQFDDSQLYCFYYAHLDRYAAGLKEGQHVNAGDVIGYAGSTGNADPGAPHLHFALFRLGPAKEWWKGDPVNPYQSLLDAVKRP